MKVLVPKGFTFNKIIGVTTLSLLCSFGASAMENPTHHHDCCDDESSSSSEEPPPPPPENTNICVPNEPIGWTGPSHQTCQTTQQQGECNTKPSCTTQQTGQTSQQAGCTTQQTSQTCQTGQTSQQVCTVQQGDWTNQQANAGQWGWGQAISQNSCQHNNSKVKFYSQQKAGIESQSWWVENEQKSDANWQRTHWQQIYLNNISFNNIQQRNSTWDQIHVNAIVANNWDLSHSVITNTTFKGHYTNIDFSQSFLQNVVFDNATFERKNHYHSHFKGTRLQNVWFINDKIGGVDFSGAFFENVYFECSTLAKHNKLRGAFVQDAQGKIHQLRSKHLTQLQADLARCKGNHINLNTWYVNYQKIHGKGHH